ncbi:hypothetical protein DC366_09680 [Pelagivirga sediminicola]|uniref:DUF2244 domain-containing protein n=2 Tax=Pelagivirga sediminicola TaxID=2170575 RepID=A0A2T7G7S4_9RHOB|nr:hypothetical protein DC366_09680 [Pelagivirga sediminicola]
MPEGPLRKQRDVPAHYIEALPENVLRRGVLRFAAVASMTAAAGLWLVPVLPGDAVMQLFKLAVSAVLALGGVAILARTRTAQAPEVHVDTQQRRLTIIERDAQGHVRSRQCHAVDGLTEIVLRDNMLSARDTQGAPLFALPVSDPAVEAALRRMLA